MSNSGLDSKQSTALIYVGKIVTHHKCVVEKTYLKNKLLNKVNIKGIKSDIF